MFFVQGVERDSVGPFSGAIPGRERDE